MISIPKWAQSSIDPTQVSLTITSAGKALVGVLTTVAIIRGIDPMIVAQNASTVSDAAQNIVAQYVAVLPALYAAWHSAQTIWGVARKLATLLFGKQAPSNVTTTTSN